MTEVNHKYNNEVAPLTNIPPETSPIMQQIGMLNLRINDMITQLNAVLKILMDDNVSLKKENADLKAMQ